MKQRILFICMGNICRSPLAENLFLELAKQRGVAHLFEVDSAGTIGHHQGAAPDQRMCDTARKRGLTLVGKARRVVPADFELFDHLICMDEDNREDILAMGAPQDKVRLLLECDPSATICEVPDPYYGGADGFEVVYRLAESACAALLDELLAQHAGRDST